MDIGVKYCGGCNSRYDRVKFLQTIKKQYPFNYYNAKANVEYHILLVICGCFSCCVNLEGFRFKHKLIFVKEKNDYFNVVNILNKYACNNES
ncbi:MAG: hypothetical protein FH753_00670 [Firmicutes bacterium]|nr:hypothetical protein [Bacillota bacterium]